ncbi:MAG TPA: DUF948 domain-containing protein [Desulfuromonadales bacterium]|nr:DUF948 domain-containing protein [Desulfuromonadales bacterium]
MQVDVLVLIITVAVVVVALFLIPTLIQIKATAQRMERLAEEAEREVIPVVRQLKETSEHLNKISREAGRSFEELEPFIESIGDVGQFLHRFTGVARGDLGQSTGNILGLWLGLRAASKVLLKDLHKNKKGE